MTGGERGPGGLPRGAPEGGAGGRAGGEHGPGGLARGAADGGARSEAGGEPAWATDERVYEPQEDSELLALAVERHPRVGLACDVGCGSGYVTARLARVADRVIAIDLNPHAARITCENLRRAEARNALVLRGDLLSPVGARFDLVCFNPPYLPSVPANDPLELALSGGPTGGEVSARFIRMLPSHLAPGGEALLVVSTLSRPRSLARAARESGLTHEVADRLRLGFEELSLWRLRASGKRS